MAEQSGFFNALKTESGYDRKYNANDYSSNMAAIIGNGVRRTSGNPLRVTAAGGMSISVQMGRAWIEGYWYFNDTTYIGITVPTAPAGDMTRIDRVVLRLNTAIDGREIKIAYLTGTASSNPKAPLLTRDENIYELALADIKVGSRVTAITQADITDQRENKDLCGWVTPSVQVDDLLENLDTEFNEWFAEKKDTLASTTLFRRYHQRIVTEGQTSTVDFNIPQYDPTGVDIIDVFANGVHQVEGTDYTATKTVITFTDSKIAGSEIDIYVYKSVDGTGLGSVEDELEDLQNQVSTIKNIGEYLYICNGVDDNVKISEIVTSFFGNGELDESAQLTLNVYGTFGATNPVSGSGTSISRYRWFSFAPSTNLKRRVTIDFLNASPIKLNGTDTNHYICFYGANFTIKNATIIARQRANTTDGSVTVFVASGGEIEAENCRFDVSAYMNSYIAGSGRFTNCNGTVTNSRADSYCFNIDGNGLLRIFGGSYAAYTGLSTSNTAVITDGLNGSSGVLAIGVSCPKKAKASHYQTGAVRFSKTGTKGLIQGMFTTLSVSTAIGGGVTVANTIPVDSQTELSQI